MPYNAWRTRRFSYKREPSNKAATRRKIWGVLVCLFLISFFSILFAPLDYFFNAPLLKYSVTGNDSDMAYSADYELPNVAYSYKLFFEAKGSFSVNNKISVYVTLYNIRGVSEADFSKYFTGVSFTHCYAYPLNVDYDNSIYSAVIQLEPVGNGYFKGSMDVVWMIDGPTWGPSLVPNVSEWGISLVKLNQNPPILTIASVQDTLSVQYNEIATKITLIIGSFSFLALAPALEVILLKKRDK